MASPIQPPPCPDASEITAVTFYYYFAFPLYRLWYLPVCLPAFYLLSIFQQPLNIYYNKQRWNNLKNMCSGAHIVLLNDTFMGSQCFCALTQIADAYLSDHLLDLF